MFFLVHPQKFPSRGPPDAQNDDFGFEVSPLEQRRPVPCHARRSLSDRSNAVATQPPALSSIQSELQDIKELMAERDLLVDHVTISRWVQRYAPELNLGRPELHMTNRSWRVDETYCRVAGEWTSVYRAVDSTGATIDFVLSAKRDCAAATRFRKTLRASGHLRPRVINVGRNLSYPRAISELKRRGELGRHCRAAQCAS